ncbi:MAG TPA: ABC transporter ATP-binding protein [Pyrinomonadaceae bacterium]|nr:ABC transporter ATP-binding protein [Pyrinomonadaceae bacterium]
MTRPIVQVERVSKSYRIGGLHPGYMTFREMFAGMVSAPLRRLRGDDERRPSSQTIWALKDVSFEVRPGETVGFVGRNGAGKSTLLKILSRVTKPTAGEAALYGRVGSLLEVGTGFHPDLTGRENVFLNGAILGMRREEIARKFDEIVAFSELEQFIETPVKFYSSGMYVRLAFSVAAHLEPEILIMDEVLAVGDAAFQQKCLDKMNDIRREGRTIFFVSHDTAAVTRLCRRALFLERGRVVADGPAHEVISEYLSANWQARAERDWDEREAPGGGVARLRRLRVSDERGETLAVADIRRPVRVELTYEVLQPGHTLAPHVEIYNDEGAHLFSTHDTSAEWRRAPRPAGTYTSAVEIPGNLLPEGTLLAYASIVSHFPATALHAQEREGVAFQVVDALAGDSARGDYTGPIPGALRPLLPWATRFDAPGGDENFPAARGSAAPHDAR